MSYEKTLSLCQSPRALITSGGAPFETRCDAALALSVEFNSTEDKLNAELGGTGANNGSVGTLTLHKQVPLEDLNANAGQSQT